MPLYVRGYLYLLLSRKKRCSIIKIPEDLGKEFTISLQSPVAYFHYTRTTSSAPTLRDAKDLCTILEKYCKKYLITFDTEADKLSDVLDEIPCISRSFKRIGSSPTRGISAFVRRNIPRDADVSLGHAARKPLRSLGSLHPSPLLYGAACRL